MASTLYYLYLIILFIIVYVYHKIIIYVRNKSINICCNQNNIDFLKKVFSTINTEKNNI